MKWQQFLVNIFQRMSREVEQVLDGLTTEDLHKRPSPGANPIGWLIWHATRSLDRTIGDAIFGEQLWISEGWHKKFNLPPDHDTGYGHTDAQVDSLRITDVQALLDYHQAVMKVMLNYLENLSEDDLDKECPYSVVPGTKQALYLRIAANINDTQHIGQAGYVRGLIKGHRWYGK